MSASHAMLREYLHRVAMEMRDVREGASSVFLRSMPAELVAVLDLVESACLVAVNAVDADARKEH